MTWKMRRPKWLIDEHVPTIFSFAVTPSGSEPPAALDLLMTSATCDRHRVPDHGHLRELGCVHPPPFAP
jgi:hypothetical protein